MPTFHCEYCGTKFPSVANLTSVPCYRHPDGPNKGRHKLYEGDEKSRYTCKYCGTTNTSIANLTSIPCPRHPKGNQRGHHAPAL
jgi:DNA-directed RNA polymerase subunit RPC12/RpoP